MEQYFKSKNIHFALANLPQLVFEITDACNLKCKYCAYGEFYDDYDNPQMHFLERNPQAYKKLMEEVLIV
jgi:sulfatase maturation enzyme AslB (radical SAM superfamily)